MFRKCATFAFGLALIVALGFEIAHAQVTKAAVDSRDFSAPCEPVSLAFKATGKSKAISTSDSTFASGNAVAPADAVRRYRLKTVTEAIPRSAPLAFPPLLHRPPPSNS